MTPVDPSVLRRKLAVITANLQALEPVAAMPLKRYRADLFTRKGTERLLQELIEAAIMKAQDLFPRYVAAVERHLEGKDRGR